MSIVLYHYEPGSTSSQKVLLCLHYKGLDYVSKNVSLDKNEHLSDPYLTINSYGVLPTLIHNDSILKEAHLINEYLDRVFPEPPLMPITALAIYRTQQMCKRQEHINEQCLRYFSYYYTKKDEKILEKWMSDHPLIDRRRFLRHLHAKLKPQELQEMEDYLLQELILLNNLLKYQPWIGGDNYSLADIAWTTSICRIYQLNKESLLTDNHLHDLLSWFERIRSMPNFQVMKGCEKWENLR